MAGEFIIIRVIVSTFPYLLLSLHFTLPHVFRIQCLPPVPITRRRSGAHFYTNVPFWPSLVYYWAVESVDSLGPQTGIVILRSHHLNFVNRCGGAHG